MQPLAAPPDRPPVEPDLRTYDHVIVAFSGGKDSLASFIATVDLARAQGRDLLAEGALEFWHHDVDGRESQFMDWPITTAYVRAVAAAFRVPLYFSWKIGGFFREMTRKDTLTAPTAWEEPDGALGQSGGERGKPGTRMRFPQVTADLKTRWCSAYLKIDVGAAALRNQDRFTGSRTLVVSGERAEESPGRARYKVLEPDRSNRPGKRHVDRWRPVHGWSTAQVWEAIRRWGIVPHPAYRAGFGRVSCAFCIFGSPDQWATLREIMPAGFDRIAGLERGFGVTIARKESVEQRANRGQPYSVSNEDMAEGRRLAVQHVYNAPILVPPEAWVLPAGAFAEGAGPV